LVAANWNFGVQLDLYNPSGARVRRDYAGSGFSVRVDTFVITQTGTWQIHVADNDGQQTGNYSLCLQRTNNPVGARSFAYGQTLQDTLRTQAQMKVYSFTAANEMVSVLLAASWNFGSQVELYSPAGALLQRVYSGSGFSLRLDTVRLASGNYSIFVLDNDGQQTGDYGIHLQRITTPAQSRLLTYGQTLQDTVRSRSQIKAYMLTGAASDIVTVLIATSWNFGPQLEIYSPQGRLVRRIYAGSGFSIRLDTMTLGSSGIYSIFVLDNDGQQTGDFGMHLQRTNQPSPRRPLIPLQTVPDTLKERAQINAYSICAFVNDVITIRMPASWNFGAQLELYSPVGVLLQRVYAGSGFTAMIDAYRVSSNGSHTLFALDNDGQQIGTYTITLVGGRQPSECTNSATIELGGSPNYFVLGQNYPNPFNPETKIKYQIPNSSEVTLKVFDLLGREVATLVNERLQPGSYETTFDGKDLSSGVYLYRLQAGGFVETKKLLLLR
jgi:hypothetical protein